MPDLFQDQVDIVPEIHSDIGCDLIVSASAGVQGFALLANPVCERSFDVHVNILKLNGPIEDTGFDICSDFVQAGDNGLGGLTVDNAASPQHCGMSHGPFDVEQG